jgi:hypothetical protein
LPKDETISYRPQHPRFCDSHCEANYYRIRNEIIVKTPKELLEKELARLMELGKNYTFGIEVENK